MLRNRKGFTLIELLIVVVIIGILAAIAIPKFANTKDKAKVASLKADLRNLQSAEEAYFSDNNAYSTSAASVNFTPSSGNVLTINTGTATGWDASITNPSISGTPNTCTVGVGSSALAAGDGVIACQ